MSTTFQGGAAVGGAPSATGSGYPVDFQAEYPTNPGKLYAIPLLGYVIRVVLLIPHVIALAVMLLVVEVCQLFTWIPVLFTGKYPPGLYNLASGTIRWAANIQGYLYGLTDQYPPFGLSGEGYPLHTTFQYPESSSRLYAVPLLGIVIRYVLLIPHFIVVYVLGIIVALIQYVAWIPVLFGGTYPDWAYQMVTGYIRWSARTFSYLLGLTDKYPPFQMAA